MRLVYFSTFAKDSGGGAGRVAFELVEAMALHGHEVLFICPGDETSCEKGSDGITRLTIKSFGSAHVRIPALGTKAISLIYKTLDEFAPELLHVHDQGGLQLIGLSWALENNVPVVMTFHILPSKFKDFGFTELFGKFFQKFEGLVSLDAFDKYSSTFYEKVTAFVALNEPIAKELSNLGYEDSVTIIPNGRFLAKYNQRKLPSMKETPKRFVYVGHITTRKNQRYLVEVFKNLSNDFVLDLVGGSFGTNFDYTQDLKDYVSENGITNINFVGEVPHDEVGKYLEKAHFFVSASLIEVQSLVVIEALASGTPVLGLSNETIDEFIDERVGFKFDQNTSPEVFAKKIKEMCLLSSDNYKTLCEQARLRVSELDWSRVVEKTTVLYEQLLANREVNPRPRLKDRWESLKGLLPKSLDDDVDFSAMADVFKGMFIGEKVKSKRFILLAFLGVLAVGTMYLVDRGLAKLEKTS